MEVYIPRLDEPLGCRCNLRSDHNKDRKITDKLLTDSLTAVHCSEEELISKKKEVSCLKKEFDKTD